MASAVVIPIIVVAILGLLGYLIYKFVLYDLMCRRNVSQILNRYNIRETPFQIIKEYHDSRGESLSDREIGNLEKNYRQSEPEQFLAMYDAVRENLKNKDRDSSA